MKKNVVVDVVVDTNGDLKSKVVPMLQPGFRFGSLQEALEGEALLRSYVDYVQGLVDQVRASAVAEFVNVESLGEDSAKVQVDKSVYTFSVNPVAIELDTDVFKSNADAYAKYPEFFDVPARPFLNTDRLRKNPLELEKALKIKLIKIKKELTVRKTVKK